LNKPSLKILLVLLVSVIYLIAGGIVVGWLGLVPLIIAICVPHLFKTTLILYITLTASNLFLMFYVGSASDFLDSLLALIGLPHGSHELALLYAFRSWGLGLAGFMTFVGYDNYTKKNVVRHLDGAAKQ